MENKLIKVSLFLCLTWFTVYKHSAQTDSSHFIHISAGAGPTFGLGTMSSRSANNPLGRYKGGLNIKGFAEIHLLSRITAGISYDQSIYFFSNPGLHQRVSEKHPKNFGSLGVGTSEIDVYISRYSFTAGWVYGKDRLSLQLRFEAGYAEMDYDYVAAFSISEPDSTNNPMSIFTAPRTNFEYLTLTNTFLTLVPELKVKYILSRKKVFDTALNAGVNLFLCRPTVRVFERKEPVNRPGETVITELFSISQPLSFLNYQVGFSFIFKRKVRQY